MYKPEMSVRKRKVLEYVWVVIAGFLMVLPNSAKSKLKEYPVFDGRVYNGQFYPKIEVVEWGTPSHMEFQMYSKAKPIEVSFKLIERGNKKVMLVHYFLTDRGEHVCRSVLAPNHFSENFKVYKDISDHEMDNIIVSVNGAEQKPGLSEIKTVPYVECPPEEEERSPATNPNEGAAASTKGNATNVNLQSDHAIQKEEGKVPFTDWY